MLFAVVAVSHAEAGGGDQMRKYSGQGVVGLVMLGLLSGCTTPMFTMPAGTTNYRVGFAEGCDAGYAVAGSPFYSKLDGAEPRRGEEDFQAGWFAGFNRCKTSYERVQNTIASFLGPPL